MCPQSRFIICMVCRVSGIPVVYSFEGIQPSLHTVMLSTKTRIAQLKKIISEVNNFCLSRNCLTQTTKCPLYFQVLTSVSSDPYLNGHNFEGMKPQHTKKHLNNVIVYSILCDIFTTSSFSSKNTQLWIKNLFFPLNTSHEPRKLLTKLLL